MVLQVLSYYEYSTTSVGIKNIAFENLNVYPNPVNELLNIDIDEELKKGKPVSSLNLEIIVHNLILRIVKL